MPYYFIPIFIMLIVISATMRKNHLITAKKAIQNRKTEDKAQMLELAQKFIDKECILYTFDGRRFDGVIKEVSDGAVLLEKEGSLEAINLDFVIRLREYPKNKNGKKKSIILD